jgi:hypothetical protein
MNGMKVNNGIIIDGVLHELVLMRNSSPCDNCSLQEQCRMDRPLCKVIAGYYNSDERFINRGKVTEIKTEEEKK